MNYNLIVTGHKSFDNYELLKNKLDNSLKLILDKGLKIRILTGDFNDGADGLAKRYAKENGYELELFTINSKDTPEVARVVMYSEMLKEAHGTVSFYRGAKKAKTVISTMAKKKGISHLVFLDN